MGGVGPLELTGAVNAVALILDGQPVEVLGLDGRHTYPHESTSTVVTVSVHLDNADAVDQVGHLFALDANPQRSHSDLYSRAGDWQGRVHVSLYGSVRRAAGAAAGVAS